MGAGSWGTAISAVMATHAEVALWARRAELAGEINANRSNPQYLADVELPETVRATGADEEALDGCDLVLMAVPSHGYRAVLERVAPHIAPTTPIISLTKGIEEGSLLRMTEITLQILTDHDPRTVGVLTGPNLASEIARRQPAASVLAMPDEDLARAIQPAFMNPTFRVYTNPDVVGCEAAGALKNVMAIAAGIADGLGYGGNTLAALITRALAELTRLGVAMGGRPLTFAGLAGMGDLIVTCVSARSRNHAVGVELGKGRRLGEILKEMKMVAEGVRTTRAVLDLAERHGVEMPIATQVGAVLYEGREPAELVPHLMTREAKSELDGLS